MNRHLVSIIMSVYNEKEKWINQSVESLLNQTYENIEIIIVNDNPTNFEISEYLQLISRKDERIKIINNDKNIGLAMSMNKAIRYSNGRYIARMDADDISDINRISEQVVFFDNNKVDLVFTNCLFIDEGGEDLFFRSSIPTENDKIKRILKHTNVIIHPSVMFTKESVEKLKGYRNFDTAQDYDLWLRYLSDGFSFGGIDKPLIKYRQRSGSITNSKRLKQVLTDNYQKKLYNERTSNEVGEDSFSKENLESYFNKKGLFNARKINSFEKANNSFDEGILQFKNRKYIPAIIEILKGMVTSSYIRKKVNSIIIYKFLK